jgi:tetratricopeptide (TPR) repeat protein
VGDSATLERRRQQLEVLGRSLAAVLREVNGIYEIAFGKEAVAREPVPDLSGLGPRDAEGIFARARRLYWDGEYAEALSNLRKAVALRELDARFWSFKALAERALGEREAAVASARRAAALRKLDLPDPDTFGVSLERVQGAERRFLNAP